MSGTVAAVELQRKEPKRLDHLLSGVRVHRDSSLSVIKSVRGWTSLSVAETQTGGMGAPMPMCAYCPTMDGSGSRHTIHKAAWRLSSACTRC